MILKGLPQNCDSNHTFKVSWLNLQVLDMEELCLRYKANYRLQNFRKQIDSFKIKNHENKSL
ncbi:hypothetical protein HNP37_001659 [Flavobacterium nitrogenifigens]|uniref:Uncharacterized protein n=2 Tax=Flavobacterium TaxID=237 RepID=A0A7W7IWE4_9FLAO|nr:hypothetical protein [Flavobacterium nitrogenifigens]MBB6386556.1 hypothetical protein [Flavobacterium notoginsengisoli]